jgi:hypothetical protein
LLQQKMAAHIDDENFEHDSDSYVEPPPMVH